MLEVEWTNQALDKIEQISEFISLDSSSAATKWAELIFSKEMVLIDSPKIGRKVPEYKDESIREIIVGNYRLVYRIKEKCISIITVKNCKEKRTIA